jgi:hypothetical protein
MYRLLSVVALGFVLCLAGCGQKPPAQKKETKPNVEQQTKKDGCTCEGDKKRDDCTCDTKKEGTAKTTEPVKKK